MIDGRVDQEILIIDPWLTGVTLAKEADLVAEELPLRPPVIPERSSSPISRRGNPAFSVNSSTRSPPISVPPPPTTLSTVGSWRLGGTDSRMLPRPTHEVFAKETNDWGIGP